MNTTRVNQAIAIMERAKVRDSVKMDCFQSHNGFSTPVPVLNEASLHACGNKACFAGHIAISPEFQGDGGSVGRHGEPIYLERKFEFAISKWLEISDHLASSLIYNQTLYQRDWEHITADDVICVLTELRDNGEDAMMEKLLKLSYL